MAIVDEATEHWRNLDKRFKDVKLDFLNLLYLIIRTLESCF